MDSHASDAFDALPWWLAALAALIVGVLTMASAGDVWASLIRSGIAFVVFCVIGFIARQFLKATASRTGDRTHASLPETTDKPKTDSVSSPDEFAGFPREDQE